MDNKNNNKLEDLKEELQQQQQNIEEKEENINDNNDDIFIIHKKRKNVSDGTVQATFYIKKEQQNYISKTAKEAGMSKSEFVQKIFSIAMQKIIIQ